MKILWPLVLFGLIFVSCSKSNSDFGGSEKYYFEYQFELDDCTTDRQRTETLDELCDRLLDDGANNTCARFLREREYNNRCQ